MVLLLFFFTLVTGPRRSLSLNLSDTRVYEPQMRARDWWLPWGGLRPCRQGGSDLEGRRRWIARATGMTRPPGSGAARLRPPGHRHSAHMYQRKCCRRVAGKRRMTAPSATGMPRESPEVHHPPLVISLRRTPLPAHTAPPDYPSPGQKNSPFDATVVFGLGPDLYPASAYTLLCAKAQTLQSRRRTEKPR